MRGVTNSERLVTRSNGAEGSAEKTCGGTCPYGDGGGPKGQAQGQGESFGQREDSSKGGSSEGWSEKERSGSGRRRAISLEARERRSPTHRGHRRAGGWSRSIHREGLPLCSGGQSRGYPEEVGSGRRRHQLVPETFRNNRRGGVESSRHQPQRAVPDPRLPTRLRATGDRRASSTWTTRSSAGSGNGEGGLDVQSGRGRRSCRRRRVGSIAGERSSPDCSRSCGTPKEEGRRQFVGEQVQEEEKEKEEKRKSKEEDEGIRGSRRRREEEGFKEESGWPPPQDRSAEATTGAFRGHGIGREGEDQEPGDVPSPEVRLQKEGEVQFVKPIVEHLRLHGRSGFQGGGPLPGGEQGQSCGRTIPGHPEFRNFTDDARQPADQPRRGQARHVSAAGSYTILSARNFEKGQRGVGPRNVDAGNSNRPRCEGPAGLGMRRVVSASEVVRKHGSRHNVADCAKNGDPPGRAVGHSSQGGAAFSPEGDVSGCKNQLPCKGQGKRKRERRKVRLQGGLQRRPRERQRERSRWKEGRQEEGGEIDEDGYDGRSLEDLGGPPGKEDDEEAVGERPGNGPDADLSPEVLNGDHPGRLVEPVDEIPGFSKVDSKPEACLTSAGTSQLSGEKIFTDGFQGSGDFSLGGMGEVLLQQLLEVFTSLRSKPTGSRNPLSVFPLPTSRSLLASTFPHLTNVEVTWLLLVCLGLNSMWGGDSFYDGLVSGAQRSCLLEICKDVSRICSISGAVEAFDWSGFFRTRTVDYQGDEVKVARSFCWGNIAPALPEEIGRVPLSDICTLGCKYYVDHFDLFVKPRDQWPNIKKPKVMVADPDWAEVCAGLVSAGVCRFVPREELFERSGWPAAQWPFWSYQG